MYFHLLLFSYQAPNSSEPFASGTSSKSSKGQQSSRKNRKPQSVQSNTSQFAVPSMERKRKRKGGDKQATEPAQNTAPDQRKSGDFKKPARRKQNGDNSEQRIETKHKSKTDQEKMEVHVDSNEGSSSSQLSLAEKLDQITKMT